MRTIWVEKRCPPTFFFISKSSLPVKNAVGHFAVVFGSTTKRITVIPVVEIADRRAGRNQAKSEQTKTG
jgi:hypothetical protein